MIPYVALLRAVNVGGTGKLAMSDLRAICASLGFAKARTYIASGNVVFETDLDEAGVKRGLEAALAEFSGRAVGVLVRSGAQMAAILAANPFKGEPANRTVAIFLDAPPPGDFLAGVKGLGSERIVAGEREIYVLYGEGMGASKLRIAAAREGTARNLNTVAKLAEWANA